MGYTDPLGLSAKSVWGNMGLFAESMIIGVAIGGAIAVGMWGLPILLVGMGVSGATAASITAGVWVTMEAVGAWNTGLGVWQVITGKERNFFGQATGNTLSGGERMFQRIMLAIGAAMGMKNRYKQREVSGRMNMAQEAISKEITANPAWNSNTRKKIWKEKGYSEWTPTREVIVRKNKTWEIMPIVERKELHHINAQRNGWANTAENTMEVWPLEHAAIDSYRKPGYKIIDYK